MPSRMRVVVPVLIVAALVAVLTVPVPAEERPAAAPSRDALALGPVLPPITPEDETSPDPSTVPPSEPYGDLRVVSEGAEGPAVEGPVLEQPDEQPPARGPSAEQPTQPETPSEAEPAEAQPGERQPPEGPPAEGKPAEGPPPEEKPGEAEPPESQPAEEKPPEEMPGETEQPPPAVEPEPLPPLSPEVEALRDPIRRVLGYFYNQPFNTRDNCVTDILNADLVFGCNTEVRRGGPTGEKLNGITCLCWNYPCAGFEPLLLSEGHIAARVGYGLQTDPGQMLAVLALSRVPHDYPVRVGDDVRTVDDLVENEKLWCREGIDQSHRLIGLAYYLRGDETWENSLGQTWSIERMVARGLAEPIVTGVDGGTHRLMALSYAVEQRAREGLPIEGDFDRAARFLADFQDFAFKAQRSDGGWGPGFFNPPANGADWDDRLRSTGHILRWLAFSLPREQLEGPQTTKAVNYLVRLLESYRQRRMNVYQSTSHDIDSVAHALHALAIYDARVFRAREQQQAEQAAAATQPANDSQ